ncbi:MAG: DUF2283 domain-containing protein [Dehalococcoidia bacterium]|nr:DUF2283 domain-containing protein [Dehalococcoidia bacterium]
MRISYDAKFDVLYLKFIEGTHHVANQNLTEDIALDLDEKGKIVGIEFLSASKYFDLSTLLPITVERA